MEQHRKPIPKVAAIHDLSGFGRSSLMIAIPILSVMGIQTCPLQTAYLSTQTDGFEDYQIQDLSIIMEKTVHHWEQLDLAFDGIYSGFLGSSKQIDIVTQFIRKFRGTGQTKILVDPVLGDGGKLYDPFSDLMVSGMRKMIREAQVITPNYTEACLLLDHQYKSTETESTLASYAKELSEMGPEIIIITSAPIGLNNSDYAVLIYDGKIDSYTVYPVQELPGSFPGTGDMFSSVVMGTLIQGETIETGVRKAIEFVSKAIKAALDAGTPEREGALLETALPSLLENECGESP